MIKNENHFYIDESGGISNDSRVFIHGCIIKDEIDADLYFESEWNKLKESGFHATENHPDVRTMLYRKMPYWNFRAYFVLLNKDTQSFQTLKATNQPFEIFRVSLHKLLADRLLKSKNDKNYFYFEEIKLEGCTLDALLKDFFSKFKNIDCTYNIVSKAETNLASIDYLNYILFSLLNDNKKRAKRMIDNFELIKPKIASIHYLNEKLYFSRKKNYSLNDIIELFDGKG
jgi:hypothetical protein